jgi:hypothetical protein
LVGKPEGTRLQGYLHRQKDNIKMHLKEIGWESVDWIQQAQDMDEWQALGEHGNKPSGSIQTGEFLE